jgi:hypothetical protein
MYAYSKSKLNSISRNILFDISKEQFDEKRKECCYLCGKQNSETHKNGIDRVDSLTGYIQTNIQSCCESCNYMKNNYILESFLDKCLLITIHHKPTDDIIQLNYIVQGNKLSVEEKRERERIRKQKQREELRKKYGDEEYKKIHAKKIADQRNKK